jgi:hypothetical protein
MGQKGYAMWKREHLCIQRTLDKKKTHVAVWNNLNITLWGQLPDEAFLWTRSHSTARAITICSEAFFTLTGSNNADTKVSSVQSAKTGNCHNMWQQDFSSVPHFHKKKSFLKRSKMFRCSISELRPITSPVTSLQCFLFSVRMFLDCLIPYVANECLECCMYTKLLFCTWQHKCDCICWLMSEAWTISFSSHCISTHPAQNPTMSRDSEKHDHVLMDRTQCLPTFPDEPWCHPRFLRIQESSLATLTYVDMSIYMDHS